MYGAAFSDVVGLVKDVSFRISRRVGELYDVALRHSPQKLTQILRAAASTGKA